jgi:hypothetical protein
VTPEGRLMIALIKSRQEQYLLEGYFCSLCSETSFLRQTLRLWRRFLFDIVPRGVFHAGLRHHVR